MVGSYTTSLTALTKPNNTLDSTNANIEKLHKIFASELVYVFFTNPTINLEKNVIDEISMSSMPQSNMTNFLNIFTSTKRLATINDITKKFESTVKSLHISQNCRKFEYHV